MPPQQASIQITYPTSSAPSFNLEYYLSSHFPLVEKVWGPQGLRSWTITTGDKDSGYHVQTTLVWDSIKAFENMKKDIVEQVMGDVKNFSDVPPSQKIGFIVGQATIAK